MTHSTDERGSITVFVLGVVVALVVVGGLVLDGGTIIAGHREADDEAAGAARAAAQAIAATARQTGALTIDAGVARTAAERYLLPYGHAPLVSVDGDQVTIRVAFPVTTQILSIVGVRHKTVTGTASATAVGGGP